MSRIVKKETEDIEDIDPKPAGNQKENRTERVVGKRKKKSKTRKKRMRT